ncbi:HtrA protease/chaperone protein [Roseibacterium elongatum DSM 19469]|uniref:HtrA protease/chaperone protein n=1 Tax=Roseicyclus elongatus DSM 19469 TaxID=1294273 RepID=W8SRF2_9RHOB|nr:Do family serine endopeptidase [Roseibacterium elongatum]AHM05110.1 HtrA protease/chaperone protein [Roseibacterium elongatum DSM 19469]
MERTPLNLLRIAPSVALAALLSTGLPAGPAPAQDSGFDAPADFSQMVSERLPAVVGILSTGPAPEATTQAMPQLPPGLREFFGRPGPRTGPSGPQGPMRSQGSGFVISSDGLIVTNNHVIDGAEQIEVVLTDDRRLEATLVGTDPATDIALLRVEGASDLPSVSWGESDTVSIGQWVVAIGNPFGLGGTVTAGIVSARSRDINAGPYDDFIQTDAAINRGNSGGPLFDASGDVIGVNTAIFSPSGGNVGIGFAVPSAVAERVVAELQDDGRVDRGWLGVQVQALSDRLAAALGIERADGVLIAEVSDDGPAARAGLEPGDVILSVGGEAIDAPRALSFAIAELPVGEPVRMGYWRDGVREETEVTIGLRAAAILADDTAPAATAPEAARSGPSIGVAVTPLSGDLRARSGIPADVRGLFVQEVAPGSAAAEAGLRAGDVMVSADAATLGQVDTLRDVIDLAAGEDGLLLVRFWRDGRYGYTRVDIPTTTATDE